MDSLNPCIRTASRSAAVLLVVVVGTPLLSAQTALSLEEAIARARTRSSDARIAAAAEREAATRVAQARSSLLPRVDLSESWQRGNQPVFVFSSLLARREFAAGNFALDALNHPPATDAFRTAVTVEQPLFAPATRADLRSARIGHDISTRQRSAVGQELAVQVTQAYGRVMVAAASLAASDAALEAAVADREIVGNRRDAGRATDADVLQLDVHVARVREQQIRAGADEKIARATLNELMAEPLDAPFSLGALPPPPATESRALAELETEALANRPDLQVAVLQEEMAAAARDSARSAFLPQVSMQGGWELNGGTWSSRASGWFVGAAGRLNLFQGFRDRARIDETTTQIERRALEREKTETAIRLELRIGLARLEEANAREVAGRTAAAQARESQRIIRDRYESGLADVVALLRSAEAVLDADLRHVGARADVVIATATVNRILGK